MSVENTADRVLLTSRLILEPLSPGHAAEMVAVLADSGLYAFIGGQPPTQEELAHRYALQSGNQSGEETWLNWIIRTQETESAAGFVQTTLRAAGPAGDDASADLAWVVGLGHQGRGYATEAAQAMVAWLTRQGVSRFSAQIHPGNVASAGVAARLGLAPTGIADADGEQLWRLERGGAAS